MFPLGSVLVPGMLLPLHVFEPRYRALVRDVLDGDGRFGVALIERGSEVGGGDQRSMAGTVARVLQAEESPDGRWGVVAMGEERIRVTAWLVDDPYPRATTEPWPEDPTPVDVDAPARVLALVRRAIALHVELGDLRGGIDVEIADDPVVASHQLCAAAPVGPADRQRLLCAAGPAARLTLLEELVTEELEVATFRLGGDGP
jgi:Lon protease-like protein